MNNCMISMQAIIALLFSSGQVPRRSLVGGAFSRPEFDSDSTPGERIRPSSDRPKNHRKHPPRPSTLHPTDTLEPCTES